MAKSLSILNAHHSNTSVPENDQYLAYSIFTGWSLHKMSFNLILSDLCFYGSNQQYVTIVSCNLSRLNWQQAIIWINDTEIADAYMRLHALICLT